MRKNIKACSTENRKVFVTNDCFHVALSTIAYIFRCHNLAPVTLWRIEELVCGNRLFFESDVCGNCEVSMFETMLLEGGHQITSEKFS